MTMPNEIKRGEMYWVDWSPGRGSEQSGLRPALIIQNDVGNKYSPKTIVAACSTADVKTSYPFIVLVTKKESGSTRDFHVNLSAILTIDKSYLRDKCGQLKDDKMAEIDKAIKNSLAIA
jgi:mRNA interferase MazF